VEYGDRRKLKRVTAEKKHDIEQYFWKTDRYLIYALGSHLFRVDVEAEKTRADEIMPSKNAAVSIVDELKGFNDEILIQIAFGKESLGDVYRLNVFSLEKQPRPVARHPNPKRFGMVQCWVADNAGEVCAAISVRGIENYLLTRQYGSSRFELARIMDFRRSIDEQCWPFLFYTEDNKALFAISRMRRDRDTAAVAMISSRTGKEIRCLYCNPRADIEGLAFSRKRRAVAYASFHNSKLQHKSFDPKIGSVFKKAGARFRGCVLRIVATDQAENRFILLVSSDRIPGVYYLWDTSVQHRNRVRKLGEIAPWLNPRSLLPVRPIKFKSGDGLTIHGYLTLPARRQKNLPLVINVHGGPDDRNYWHYEPLYSREIQFMANRGYAVLQVNFRGSIGYGRAFWEKGFRERGRKMQDDITDAVRWAIRCGIADPKRIAVYGKSYGGYAALAGAVFTPTLYRAAISYAGVSNWLTWLKWLKVTSPNDPFLPREYVKTGDPQKDRKRLELVAPALHADRVKTPLLIVHAAHDTQVPQSESDQMVAALRDEAADVQYIVLPNDGHILHSEKNKIRFYSAVEAFLAKHLR
jgi:dipeptidyl aminopeptidase/acylaminoacyl peptidase